MSIKSFTIPADANPQKVHQLNLPRQFCMVTNLSQNMGNVNIYCENLDDVVKDKPTYEITPGQALFVNEFYIGEVLVNAPLGAEITVTHWGDT